MELALRRPAHLLRPRRPQEDADRLPAHDGCLGQAVQEVRTFRTITAQLQELARWLAAAGCRHVALESTGVYWKPVFNLLEAAGLEVVLVNAQHIKNVPGRKTDVKDAEWIATLLRHGLLRAVSSRPRRSGSCGT